MYKTVLVKVISIHQSYELAGDSAVWQPACTCVQESIDSDNKL